MMLVTEYDDCSGIGYVYDDQLAGRSTPSMTTTRQPRQDRATEPQTRRKGKERQFLGLSHGSGTSTKAYEYDGYGLPTVWKGAGSDATFFTDDDVVSQTTNGVPVS